MRFAIVALVASAGVMYLLGAWLMSIHGLDPPYIYFNTGVILELASFCAAIAALALLGGAAIQYGCRAILRRKPR